jgi:hypothetical protein
MSGKILSFNTEKINAFYKLAARLHLKKYKY